LVEVKMMIMTAESHARYSLQEERTLTDEELTRVELEDKANSFSGTWVVWGEQGLPGELSAGTTPVR
jgi:hypothetical protein